MDQWKQVAAIDIGSPRNNQKMVGWYIKTETDKYEGNLLDEFIDNLELALKAGPLALGFESPMFVPARDKVGELTKAREGEVEKGYKNRPFSAGAGATVLVTGLVVARYILWKLRERFPQSDFPLIESTLDWRSAPTETRQLLLFEAFVTEQPRDRPKPHIWDARQAVEAFQLITNKKEKVRKAQDDNNCLSLLGAILLHSKWTTEPKIIYEPCLVVFARNKEKWGLEANL